MKTIQLTDNEYGFARVLLKKALEQEKAALANYEKDENLSRLAELKEIEVSAIQTLIKSMFNESL